MFDPLLASSELGSKDDGDMHPDTISGHRICDQWWDDVFEYGKLLGSKLWVHTNEATKKELGVSPLGQLWPGSRYDPGADL